VWLKSFELVDHGGDRIFAIWGHNFAALELVRIHVPHELAQCFKMLASSSSLVVIFYEWRRQVFALQSKGLIIGSDWRERNWALPSLVFGLWVLSFVL
jgi:hypothetical protein